MAVIHGFTIVHLKKKSTSKHLFLCFRLSQIEDSIPYLERPNAIWKDIDRHIECTDINYLHLIQMYETWISWPELASGPQELDRSQGAGV